MGWSTNQKAQQKRQKKQSQKREKQREKQQKKQSAKWKDQVTEKKHEQAKKREEKREEELARKKQLKKLAQQEEIMMEKQSLKKKNNQFNEKKLTQAQIQQRQEERLIAQFQNALGNNQDEFFHEQNPNRSQALQGYQIANTVEKALQILDGSEQRHPQRRFKAAFEAYCEKREAEIKLQYPKFKRSQRMQMMKKEFQKHPENPYNKKKCRQIQSQIKERRSSLMID